MLRSSSMGGGAQPAACVPARPGLLHFGVVPETEYRRAEKRPEAFFQHKLVGTYAVGQVG